MTLKTATSVLIVLIVLFAILATSACGDDDDEVIIEPSATPTASPTPTDPPTSPVTTIPDLPSTTQHPGLLAELAANRAKWNAAGLTDYQYQFSISCFCPFYQQLYTATIENGEPSSLTDSAGVAITPGAIDDFLSGYSTIPRLFDETATIIGRSDEITITYDPQYGFPIDIASQGRLNTADDEIYITLSNFEVSND